MTTGGPGTGGPGTDSETAAAAGPGNTPAPGGRREAGWHRVHPLTPAIKSWQGLALVAFFVVRDYGEGLLGGSADGGRPRPLPGDGVSLRVWLTGGGLVVLVAAVVLAGMVLSWRMTRYRVTAEALELRHGILFRQHRVAQLDRLQAVDVVQPLLARIFGLARLRVEVAGAGDSAIQLAYLTETRAAELRNHLLAAAAGLSYDSERAPEAPEHYWLEVTPSRLVASILLSSVPVILIAGLTGLAVAAAFVGSPAPLAAVAPMLLAMGGVVWNRFNGGFGFRAASSPDGIRLRHGLTETRTQTVPPGRVQAVRLAQPLLWRRPDWWVITVNIAGYGTAGGTERGRESLLLPVGTRGEALAVLSFVVPDLGVCDGEDPREVVDAALSGIGATHGFVTSPRQARWLDWISWRRNGFRVTTTVLLVRRGVLRRNLDLVPHARTQSLSVTQGPVQRRLGLAHFQVHSTPGPVDPRVPHLAEPVAASLLAAQAERARQARAAAGPERWMQRR